LLEIELGIDVMPTASAGQAGQDGRRSSSTRVANEEPVLAIRHHALYLALTHVAAERHSTVCAEDIQLLPLATVASATSRGIGKLFQHHHERWRL
jgi:hypothetical protein